MSRAVTVADRPPTRAGAAAPPPPGLARRVVRRWRASDPGLLRVTQAGKTLLCVVVMLAVLRGASLHLRLTGAMGAAFFLQCTSTGSHRRRQLTMLVTAAAATLSVALAAGWAGHPWARHALVSAAAFAAFYARRFLPDRGMFTVFGFILTLLATVGPGGWPTAGREAAVLGAGLAVAFVLYFALCPSDEARALADGTRTFCRHAAEVLAARERVLSADRPATATATASSGGSHGHPSALRRRLRADLATNHALADAAPPRSAPDDPNAAADPVRVVLLGQYEAAQCLVMLARGIRRIGQDDADGRVADWLRSAMGSLRAAYADLGREPARGASTGDAAKATAAGACEESPPHDLLASLEATAPTVAAAAAHAFGAWLSVAELCAAHRRIAGGLAALAGGTTGARPAARRAGAGATAAGRLPSQRLPSRPRPSPSPSPFAAALARVASDADVRTGLRAAVAAALALAVGRVDRLERSYWAVLVAVLLVSGTWGQNVHKGLTRLSMTALGCLTAWALHAAVGGSRPAEAAVMLVGVFCAAYFRTGSYAAMTFCVTVYVVFLFALLGEATSHVMWVRGYQTAIGCGVALVASALVPAGRSGQETRRQSAALWAACRGQVADTFARLLDDPPRPPAAAAPDPPQSLLRQLYDLRAHYEAATFERPLAGRRGWRRHGGRALDRVRLLTHLTLALRRAAAAVASRGVAAGRPLPGPLRGALAELRDLVLARLSDPVTDAPARRAAAPDAGDPGELDAALERVARALHAARGAGDLDPSDVVALAPVLAYARQIYLLAAGRGVVGGDGGNDADAGDHDEEADRAGRPAPPRRLSGHGRAAAAGSDE